ncbi:MAG: zf-HC2 domain-containing protein [Terriglobia bacterium]
MSDLPGLVKVGNMFESCGEIREFFSDYVDGLCPPDVRRSIRFHLHYCPPCERALERAQMLTEDLRTLPRQPISHDADLRLRVRMSHELNRNVLARLAVRVDNLIRARLLPGSVGLAAAALCFCLIMGSEVAPVSRFPDVPLSFLTPPQVVTLAPLDFNTGNTPVVVMMYIGAGGQVAGYKVLSGQHSPELMRHLDRLIYFSRFTPATAFGQPTQGAVILSLGQITVRG